MSGTPFDYFERTYVVNLAQRTDRRRETAAELASIGVGASQVRWWAATQDSDAHGFPSPGAYGCYQSHLRALTEARDDGLAHVLMVEDDLMVRPGGMERWPPIEALLREQPWDIINLGYVRKAEGDPVGPGLLRVSQRLRSTQCYAVNGAALAPLVAFLEDLQTRERRHPDGGRMHYDGALNVFCQQHPETVRWAAAPQLVSQRSSRSDIAEERWFDQAALPRVAVAKARVLKNALRRRRGRK